MAFSALKTAIGYRQILAQQDPDLRQRLQKAGMDRAAQRRKTQHDCWTVLARVMLYNHDLPAITKDSLFAFRSAHSSTRCARPGVTRCGSYSPTSGSWSQLRPVRGAAAGAADGGPPGRPLRHHPEGPITSLLSATCRRRKTSVDFTTLSGLAADIVSNWADIEKHHGVDTLSIHLPT